MNKFEIYLMIGESSLKIPYTYKSESDVLKHCAKLAVDLFFTKIYFKNEQKIHLVDRFMKGCTINCKTLERCFLFIPNLYIDGVDEDMENNVMDLDDISVNDFICTEPFSTDNN